MKRLITFMLTAITFAVSTAAPAMQAFAAGKDSMIATPEAVMDAQLKDARDTADSDKSTARHRKSRPAKTKAAGRKAGKPAAKNTAAETPQAEAPVAVKPAAEADK